MGLLVVQGRWKSGRLVGWEEVDMISKGGLVGWVEGGEGGGLVRNREGDLDEETMGDLDGESGVDLGALVGGVEGGEGWILVRDREGDSDKDTVGDLDGESEVDLDEERDVDLDRSEGVLDMGNEERGLDEGALDGGRGGDTGKVRGLEGSEVRGVVGGDRIGGPSCLKPTGVTVAMATKPLLLLQVGENPINPVAMTTIHMTTISTVMTAVSMMIVIITGLKRRNGMILK